MFPNPGTTNEPVSLLSHFSSRCPSRELLPACTPAAAAPWRSSEATPSGQAQLKLTWLKDDRSGLLSFWLLRAPHLFALV